MPPVKEQPTPSVVSKKHIKSSLDKLKSLAADNDLKIIDVAGDGDCFYHAICLQTKNRPNGSGGQLRKEFQQFLNKLPKEEKIAFAENLSYNHKAKNLSYEKKRAFTAMTYNIKTGGYAGEMEAAYMAKFLERNIQLFNSESKTPRIYGEFDSTPCIKIGFIADSKHYVGMIPNNNQHTNPNISIDQSKNMPQIQWQIINLALLDSMGNRAKFIHRYQYLHE